MQQKITSVIYPERLRFEIITVKKNIGPCSQVKAYLSHYIQFFLLDNL